MKRTHFLLSLPSLVFRHAANEKFELDSDNTGEIRGIMDLGLNNNIVHRLFLILNSKIMIRYVGQRREPVILYL